MAGPSGTLLIDKKIYTVKFVYRCDGNLLPPVKNAMGGGGSNLPKRNTPYI